MQLLDDFKKNKKIREIERGNATSHNLDNSLWKGLWACRKADYVIIIIIIIIIIIYSLQIWPRAA